tara:strand:- start:557 stop:742 length:186 start_codon:yes stop_codon:yes gene_type:complete
MHWLLIILGTLILSISVSNPFYRLLFNKTFKIKTFIQILLRILLFFIALILIFTGLYLESI